MQINPLPKVLVSHNPHFLMTENGKPFFWLGDTAWELFHRLTIEEIHLYFQTRRNQGFNVIQAVALAEMGGLKIPNVYGDLPFIGYDPRQLNEPYWRMIDEVLRIANDCHLYIGFLPTWGDKVAELWGEGPVIFDPQSAYDYGVRLGRRYREQTNLIWILGGDRPVSYTSNKTHNLRNDIGVWYGMAAGIREGASEKVLITYHPWGGHSSSEYIHQEEWLDLNMMQSGHGSGHDAPVWEMIVKDYSLTPTKPTLDGEPNYEDHPVSPWPSWDPQSGFYDDYDVRKQIYRSVFAGGCGVTYGHHSVWQMCSERFPGINHTLMSWREAINRPGANQVRFLRKLMVSRPYFDRIPDQTMLLDPVQAKEQYACATRDITGKYAFIYLPVSRPITVTMEKISGKHTKASWYDPTRGLVIREEGYPGGGIQTIEPPGGGKDWVLILEDPSAGFTPLGIR